MLLNAEEMQFIVDELFVGNKLATAEIATSDGSRVDLRNIRSPIVVFCSKADNITPPQQALGWILDLYESVDDMRAHGQTIVYAVHESIGHLGIFVSASVAKKEHDEFASNIDLIDVLPPGLYEAVMIPKDRGDASADLIGGDYLVRFETRTLDDIRAMGGNNEEDERKFAAVARVSEINLGLYRTLVQPWVQSLGQCGRCQMDAPNAPAAPAVRDVLACQSVHAAAAVGRRAGAREPSARREGQCILASAGANSRIGSRHPWTPIAICATICRRQCSMRFTARPSCKRAVGLKASDANPRRRPGTDAAHLALVAQRIDELRDDMAKGGPREAVLRALLYIRMPEGAR